MASFFGVPLKKSYDVDLTKPLKNLISSFYSSSDEPIDLSDAIEHLNKSRSSCVSRSLDPKHESSLELLEKYYDQIASLESKCPPELHVQFKWKDALDKGGSFLLSSNTLSLSSLSYEKVCILFNIGAVQSQIGAVQGNEGLSNDAALRLSAKYFQSASGIFQSLKHMSSAAVGGQELTLDLTPEVLNILHVLTLAQAQEAFYYKAANDNMKEHIIAKVANQCETLYADAQKQLQLLRITQEKDWVTIVNMKQAAFRGIAEYYQSIVCQQQKEFGEQITRLQKAVDSLKTAESRGASYFTPHFRERLSNSVRALEEAKKDNDFIYHAKVPDYKSVKSIGTAALAKPTSLPERFRPNSPDLFEKLLPVAVQQAVQRLDLRKQDVVNSEIANLREQTELLNGLLASLNLPAAIEDTSGVQLPTSICEKAATVRSKGGIGALERLIHELPELFQRNREILEETERQINLEEESDNNLREQFKEKWKRTPSAQLNACWKDHISKYKAIIQNAVEADNKVKAKFNAHRDKIQLLSSDSNEALIQAVPSGSGADNNLMNAPCVVKLRQLMNEVEELKSERQSIENELKTATFSDMKSKFLRALTQDGAINEEVLSVEAIGETFGGLQKRIRESKERQESLMRKIREANDEYMNLKKNSQAGNSNREAFLIELANAYDAFIQLQSNLEEGSKFYNDLTVLLANLQSKVNDFCFARKAEREDLCKHLQNEIVSQPTPKPPSAPSYHGNTNSGQQKPPRPPPPQVSSQSSQPEQSQSTQQTTQNLPFSQPYAPNPYQQYYLPPPPLPSGFNPYPFAQTPNYTPQGYQPQQGYQQSGYPYPQQGYQQTGYPYPQQQPYGYYPQQHR
ncbi:programmed cell death 6-interacting protein-like protein, partial [Dinothrombium tinctorium]